MHAHPLEARIARVEGSFDQVNERLGSIERRLDAAEQRVAMRFDRLDRRLDSSDQLNESRFDRIDRRFDGVERRFNWLTGIMVGTWATTMLAILVHR